VLVDDRSGQQLNHAEQADLALLGVVGELHED